MRGEANPRARRTAEEVRQIRLMHLVEKLDTTQIAEKLNSYSVDISRIVRWERWAHTDHDLRDLPRPTRGLPQEVLRERRNARERAYRKRRREEANAFKQRCTGCAHYLSWTGGCHLEILELRMAEDRFSPPCDQYQAKAPVPAQGNPTAPLPHRPS